MLSLYSVCLYPHTRTVRMQVGGCPHKDLYSVVEHRTILWSISRSTTFFDVLNHCKVHAFSKSKVMINIYCCFLSLYLIHVCDHLETEWVHDLNVYMHFVKVVLNHGNPCFWLVIQASLIPYQHPRLAGMGTTQTQQIQRIRETKEYND